MRYIKWMVILLSVVLIASGIYLLLNKLFFSSTLVQMPEHNEILKK